MIRVKIGRQINKRILKPLFDLGIAVRKVPCKCEEYYPNHPRAAQVKEKLGALRFYMSTGTDEIWKLIRQAEHTSAVTCEDCGEPGELRGGSWIRTLCDKCAKEHGKEATYEEWAKEQQKTGTSMVSVMSIVLQKRANE